jgi:hypothetical protein
MTAGEARDRFGLHWYLSTEFTGKERITKAGRDELAHHQK